MTLTYLSVFLLYSALYVLLSKKITPLRAMGVGTLIALGNAMRPIGVILMLAAVLWLLIRAMRQADLHDVLHGVCVAASYALVGVLLSGLTDRLEAPSAPGLYFAGEAVNVDGTCGGYNLQWAWSSGKVAGCAAAAE